MSTSVLITDKAAAFDFCLREACSGTVPSIGASTWLRRVRRILKYSIAAEVNGLILFNRWVWTRWLSIHRDWALPDTPVIHALPDIDELETARISGILRSERDLRAIAAACLFVGGKLSDERRLKKDLAECCLNLSTKDEVNGHGHQRKDQSQWEKAIEGWEMQVLIDFGFMVSACVEMPPHFIVLPLLKQLATFHHQNARQDGGDKIRESFHESPPIESFELNMLAENVFKLISDELILPGICCFYTNVEIAVAAIAVTTGIGWQLRIDDRRRLFAALGCVVDRVETLSIVLANLMKFGTVTFEKKDRQHCHEASTHSACE